MLTYGNHFVGNNYLLSGIPDFNNNYQVYFGKEGNVYLNESATSGEKFPYPIVDEYRYTLSKTGENLQFIPNGPNAVYVIAEYGISVKPEYANEIYTGDKPGYWYNERNIWSNAILRPSLNYHFHRFNNFNTLHDLRELSYTLGSVNVYGEQHKCTGFNDISNLKSAIGQIPIYSSTTYEIESWDGMQNLEYNYEAFSNSVVEKLPTSWNFPKLKTADRMFRSNYGVRSIPDSWDGLNALENANGMFDGSNISAIPNSWNGLNKLTAANYMFSDIGNSNPSTADNYRLTAIPSSWYGLSSLKEADSMFAGISSLEKIPSSFNDLSALEIMSFMFSGTNLSATKITSWSGLEKVWVPAAAFRDTNLSSIPTSWAGLGTNLQYHINSAKPFPESTTVLDCTNMFRDSDITAIPTSWPTEWLNYNKTTDCFIVDLERMFKNCTGLTQSVKPLMDQITAHQVNWYQRGKCRIDYGGMFQGCTNIADRSLSSQSAYSAFFSSHND